jgi:hypothetical protein
MKARTLGLSKIGRDFPEKGEKRSRMDQAFWAITSIEFRLLRKTSLPFGVALFAVAKRRNARWPNDVTCDQVASEAGWPGVPRVFCSVLAIAQTS